MEWIRAKAEELGKKFKIDGADDISMFFAMGIIKVRSFPRFSCTQEHHPGHSLDKRLDRGPMRHRGLQAHF
jgi:hypothetical protein